MFLRWKLSFSNRQVFIKICKTTKSSVYTSVYWQWHNYFNLWNLRCAYHQVLIENRSKTILIIYLAQQRCPWRGNRQSRTTKSSSKTKAWSARLCPYKQTGLVTSRTAILGAPCLNPSPITDGLACSDLPDTFIQTKARKDPLSSPSPRISRRPSRLIMRSTGSRPMQRQQQNQRSTEE